MCLYTSIVHLVGVYMRSGLQS